MATKFDVSSLPLLNSAAKEYKRELPHARFPTSFLRCLSISSQEFLRANWRPTSDYKTFEDLEDDVCPDAVIRSAIRREMKLSLPITPPSTSTPPPKQAVARLTAALEEDLFMLAEAAAAAFPEGPMAAAAQRRAEAVFTAAVAEIDHNAPVYVPLINKFNPDVPSATTSTSPRSTQPWPHPSRPMTRLPPPTTPTRPVTSPTGTTSPTFAPTSMTRPTTS
ncbi:hypothetical protein J8273_5898 [Carpediemonas membranifera]|uniref:Uncharacterized protein n=1 Tax=Carpediemonas membranifera TaxID=201153 RepID=A0A8J6AS86_9EUKA|nr:hypothetical protein J8273_5898 [Carpediemonas membranifera]|eukprot:KAG9392758.1 hypothetical protein J8273_5898 [Carpediemonas membranifera]